MPWKPDNFCKKSGLSTFGVWVSANGLIPCLFKCPPVGFTANWANVEVGK